MKRYLICLLLAMLLIPEITAGAREISNKREFRGAWIQCVNGQFQGMSRDAMQRTLTYQLDELQKDGVNAIIFQVRAECDALYPSKIEPWSRFLTGVQGKAPNPYWDPLQWMIDQCHKRGMELHAWINPFRAKTKGTTALAVTHPAVKYPDRIFEYNNLYILNPGNPMNRYYICDVVKDILKRYDVDGIHIDDYFYPYPEAGAKIKDDAEFSMYNDKGIANRNDWRRENVNMFMEEIYKTIHEVKPWVKFGVSPFGIYRNKRNDPEMGSDTRGLQNYDDLYADVIKWVDKGWVDYCVPQIYWEIGHSAADYKTLIKWWNKYVYNRPLYIGEDVLRTVKAVDPDNPRSHQMGVKYALHQQMKNVKGTVLWYAKAAVDNPGNYGHVLRNVYWKYPALQPRLEYIDDKAPKKVRRLKVVETSDGPTLFWTAPRGKGWKNEAVKYVVYRFGRNEKINLDDASRILKVTYDTFYNIPEGARGVYVVTALDRMENESKGKKIKIK